MNLQRLLVLQAIITFSTFIVLVTAPSVIPASFCIDVKPVQYFLCYSIAASELSLTYLSLAAKNMKDLSALRKIIFFFITFHLVTGALGIYAIVQGASNEILGSVILRLIIALLFSYYGIYKNTNLKIQRNQS